MRDQTLGRAAYAAYCKAVSYQTHDGRPVPEWSALGIRIQEAWCVAAEAAIVTALEQMREGTRMLSVPDAMTPPERGPLQNGHRPDGSIPGFEPTHAPGLGFPEARQ